MNKGAENSTEVNMSDVARQLEELALTIKSLRQAGAIDHTKLAEAVRSLEDAVGSSPQAEGERAPEGLRQEILRALERRSPLLPIELAAVTLSLPEEIQPVLSELEREGLIEVHEGPRGRWITLAPSPHRQTRR